MRRLIYIPIIHTDPDLGQLADAVTEQAKEIVGSDNWGRHKQIVRRFWIEIENYWIKKKVSGLKVFQDGLAANGEIGKRIVKELANKGSINHRVIERLEKKGAKLVKTEDPELLKEEYFITRELIKKKSFLGGLLAYLRYKLRKDKLLRERDAYIVKRINESLEEGETGICFLGAYHQVLPDLAPDIMVITLKDPEKIKEYYQKFTTHIWEGEVNGLGRYLTTPIKIRLGKQYD